MNEKIETKSDKMIENSIGILLIMPIYMLFFVLLNFLNLNNGNNLILFPTLMYLPIIVGMALSYKIYKNEKSKLISLWILIFFGLAIYFYYKTYFIEHEGWDALGYCFLWFINTGIAKILSCIFYGKIVGWKKAMVFFIIYILLLVSSFALGFWA